VLPSPPDGNKPAADSQVGAQRAAILRTPFLSLRRCHLPSILALFPLSVETAWRRAQQAFGCGDPLPSSVK
jgi:hypothetical protein